MKKILLTLCITYFILCISGAFAQSQFWGMTSGGGDGFGTIFSTDGNGNSHQVKQMFRPNNPGIEPLGTLHQAPNGKFYGTTYTDALNNTGVIFEYDLATNTYTKKIDMVAINGRGSNGSLFLASNGKFYGIASYGGANNRGTIFEYDYVANTYTKKIDLDSANGYCQFGLISFVEATPGKLYAAGSRGGANDMGVIFEYDFTTNTYTKKLDLNSTIGSVPLNSMIKASNGKLYGTTRDGGVNNQGVIYEYDYVTNTYTKKIDLSAALGRNPNCVMAQASNGKLYGTALGGPGGFGVIFEYDYTTNTYTKKIDLVQATGWSGNSMMQAPNGKLYGTTRFGGAGAGEGVIFEYDYSTNTYTKKIDFVDSNGDAPLGLLMLASNGKLYSTASSGGIGGPGPYHGVIYEYDYITNTYAKKVDLNFGINGANPKASLVRASNGKLYGMTTFGGSTGGGTIFEYDPSANTYTKKVDLDTAKGNTPTGSLIEASNGKLYGMASAGANNDGVIFEYDYSTNTFTKKHDFNGANGSYPVGSLVQASNGKLYGVTSSGGANNDGVIFEYDFITNTFTKKSDLNSGGTGSRPVNSMIQATNGKLYGMTGVGDFGVSPGWIYEYDYTTNMISQKMVFSNANGRDPEGSLIQATNGKLYGLTQSGGANNDGVIFEYDYVTNTYVKKFDFGTTNGEWPVGALMQASNGKLYGMTSSGGANNSGVLFEYDHITNTFAKKLDFNKTNGAAPRGNLIETGASVGVDQPIQNIQFAVFPNPSSHSFTVNFATSKSKLTLNVINSLGATVHSEAAESVSGQYISTIDLSKQSKGVYFMEIVADNEKIVRKIVIQ